MGTEINIPTPYEWAGGVEKFEQLTSVFYGHVLKDPIVEPLFKHMPPDHARHVAHFLAFYNIVRWWGTRLAARRQALPPTALSHRRTRPPNATPDANFNFTDQGPSAAITKPDGKH